MTALLLVLLLGRWSAECEAKYVLECVKGGGTAIVSNYDCTVECEAGQSAGEPEGMPSVDDEEPPQPTVTPNAPRKPDPPVDCVLEASIYTNFTSSPQALIRVDYLNEDCGLDAPKIESETAFIQGREIYEGEEDPRCGDEGCEEADDPDACTDRFGSVQPCMNGCPCMSFMAWVRGLPGTHFIQVWGENEGYAGLQVELGRGQPLAGEKTQ